MPLGAITDAYGEDTASAIVLLSTVGYLCERFVGGDGATELVDKFV